MYCDGIDSRSSVAAVDFITDTHPGRECRKLYAESDVATFRKGRPRIVRASARRSSGERIGCHLVHAGGRRGTRDANAGPENIGAILLTSAPDSFSFDSQLSPAVVHAVLRETASRGNS